MIERNWNDLLGVSKQLVEGARNATRLANLSVAAVAARQLGFFGKGPHPALLGSWLHSVIRDIALFPLPKFVHRPSNWDALEACARTVADELGGSENLDGWTEAWQSSDPSRKVRGAYATPSAFATVLARTTLEPLKYVNRRIQVVDPSAGPGGLLIAAYRFLSEGKSRSENHSVLKGLRGMEIDPETRELCCFVLWLAAGSSRDDLDLIAANVKVGDALSFDWWADGAPAFDALIMNPPWESLRHSLPARHPEYASRVAILKRLSSQRAGSPGLPPLYSAHGTGDRNLFKGFMELAPHLLREGGRFGALIPGAFTSDLGMAPLRKRYFMQLALESWTGFENLRRHFLIDSRYKFGLLIGKRSVSGTTSIRARSFATCPEEVHQEHAVISVGELTRLGGAARIIPELQSQEEKDILSIAVSNGTPFFALGCLGQVAYRRELDLTLGFRKGSFKRFENHGALSLANGGRFHNRRGDSLVPVVEGRMVGQYDFFQKSWIAGRGRTAHWELNRERELEKCRPQFVAPELHHSRARLAICDVTSATNTRTVHATWIPPHWRCGNTAPVLEFETDLAALAGLGILNSMVFDWLARRIVSGLHLNKFYLKALPWPILSEEDIRGMASAAAILCESNPRFAEAGGHEFLAKAGIERLKQVEQFDAFTGIEVIVARGFRLNALQLSAILSPAKTDRRGLWRYFAANPMALTVADSAITTLEKTTPTSTWLPPAPTSSSRRAVVPNASVSTGYQMSLYEEDDELRAATAAETDG